MRKFDFAGFLMRPRTAAFAMLLSSFGLALQVIQESFVVFRSMRRPTGGTGGVTMPYDDLALGVIAGAGCIFALLMALYFFHYENTVGKPVTRYPARSFQEAEVVVNMTESEEKEYRRLVWWGAPVRDVGLVAIVLMIVAWYPFGLGIVETTLFLVGLLIVTLRSSVKNREQAVQFLSRTQYAISRSIHAEELRQPYYRAFGATRYYKQIYKRGETSPYE